MSEQTPTADLTVGDAASGTPDIAPAGPPVEVIDGGVPAKKPFHELTLTLTGDEEFAIIDAFGDGISELYMEKSLSMAYRAMEFVQFMRDGMPKKDAQKKARSLTVGEVVDLYYDDSDLLADPDTEPGKGTSAP